MGNSSIVQILSLRRTYTPSIYCKCCVKLQRFDSEMCYFDWFDSEMCYFDWFDSEMCCFEEYSPSFVVYFRFSGTLFPVSMIDGEIQLFVS